MGARYLVRLTSGLRQNNIRCKNCSLSSSVEITHGTFIINSSTINDFQQSCQLGEVCHVIEEAYQFVEYGFFNVVVNGFSAHMELYNSIMVSTSQFFSQDLVTIGLPGFQVGGLISCLDFFYRDII